jgi:hypothetical protein
MHFLKYLLPHKRKSLHYRRTVHGCHDSIMVITKKVYKVWWRLVAWYLYQVSLKSVDWFKSYYAEQAQGHDIISLSSTNYMEQSPSEKLIVAQLVKKFSAFYET